MSRSISFNRSLLVLFLTTRFLSATFLLAQPPSEPGKPLPPGPVQAKVKAACTQCHNTTRITEQHFTRDQWSAELEKMEGLGAVIADEDHDAILSYLVKNFGPSKGAKATAKKTDAAN